MSTEKDTPISHHDPLDNDHVNEENSVKDSAVSSFDEEELFDSDHLGDDPSNNDLYQESSLTGEITDESSDSLSESVENTEDELSEEEEADLSERTKEANRWTAMMAFKIAAYASGFFIVMILLQEAGVFAVISEDLAGGSRLILGLLLGMGIIFGVMAYSNRQAD